MNENIGKKVRITNPKHPHFNEHGTLRGVNQPLSLSFLAPMDEIETPSGSRFFAKTTDYTIYSE